MPPKTAHIAITAPIYMYTLNNDVIHVAIYSMAIYM